eukprot:jgi/Bigna1/54632/estExt_Genewise1Plus.C_390013
MASSTKGNVGWDSSDAAPRHSGILPTLAATERNKQVIWDVISKILSGNVLELGSGTGQHIAHFVGEDKEKGICWFPTDYTDNNFWVIRERTKTFSNVKEPEKVNLLDEFWTKTVATKLDSKGEKKFDGIYMCNVCHIAKWDATASLMKSAGKILREDGNICIYGPFIIDGKSSESNFRFSKRLQEENPDRGVREVRDIEKCANEGGLALTKIINMPANNNILVFTKKTLKDKES